MNTTTVKQTKTKKASIFQGMGNAQDTDDWTLYRTSDFELLNKTHGGFLGFLVGYKFTKKRNIPMFYFVTAEGEQLKTFGNGNLTSQIANIISLGGINHQVGILYEGKVLVDLGGDLGEKDVNQWKVYYSLETRIPTKMESYVEEIEGLIIDIGPIQKFVDDRKAERE